MQSILCEQCKRDLSDPAVHAARYELCIRAGTAGGVGPPAGAVLRAYHFCSLYCLSCWSVSKRRPPDRLLSEYEQVDDTA